LPLFVWVRPCASVLTFGLSVGPALGASEVVAPAPALVEELVPEDIEPLFELLSLVLALPLPLTLVSLPLPWAAAIWLKETASKPEKSTGKNLRIGFLHGWEIGIQESLLQTPCRPISAAPRAHREAGSSRPVRCDACAGRRWH